MLLPWVPLMVLGTAVDACGLVDGDMKVRTQLVQRWCLHASAMVLGTAY
jgi:hypothetical protein